MFHLTLTGTHRQGGNHEGVALKEPYERLIWSAALPKALIPKNNAHIPQMEKALRATFPDAIFYLEGVASGVFTSPPKLYELFTPELLMNYRTAPPAISLIIALRRDSYHNKTPILGVNLDAQYFLHPFLVFREMRLNNAYAHLEVSLLTSAGAFLGINERGLAASLGLKPESDHETGLIPLSVVIRTVLSKCSTVSHAIETITKSPRGASGIVVLADREKIAVIELTPKAFAIRDAREPFIAATQHLLSPSLMATDLPHDMEHPQKAPFELLGKRIYDGSESRLDRAYGELRRKKRWDAEGIKKLLDDEERGLLLKAGFYRTAVTAILSPERESLFLKERGNDRGFTRYEIRKGRP